MTKVNVQLLLAVLLSLSGVVLLIMGFYAPPIGDIDHSVLVAYGEISTFAGALFGVDYNYRFKIKKHEKNDSSTPAAH